MRISLKNGIAIFSVFPFKPSVPRSRSRQRQLTRLPELNMLFPAGKSRDIDLREAPQCVDDVRAWSIGIGTVRGTGRQVDMPAEAATLRPGGSWAPRGRTR